MEDHYSSSEEEVYFGTLSESEISRRRRFLGDNYNSPITPRHPRFNQPLHHTQRILPDVLGNANTSTPVGQLPAEISGFASTLKDAGDSNLDDSDDVIIVNASGNSNSIITLSDDESFSRNDEMPEKVDSNGNESFIQESASESGILSENLTTKVSEQDCESFSPHKPLVTDSIMAKNENLSRNEETFSESIEQDQGGNKCLLKEPVCVSTISNMIEVAEVRERYCSSLSSDKGFVSDSDLVEDKNYNEGSIKNTENRGLDHNCSLTNLDKSNLHSPTDSSESVPNLVNSSCSFIEAINDFIGDSNVPETPSSVTANQTTVGHSPVIPNDSQNINPCSYLSFSEEKRPDTSSIATNTTSSEEPSDLHENANNTDDGKHSLDLSHFEFSLNGVSDSILNISHGSSLPSPPDTHQSVHPTLQNPNLYEDISCDSEQLDSITNLSNVDQMVHRENVDLHMSVDEIDFQRQGVSINVSQPSDYKSCPSVYSSYNTADTSEQSDSFQSYRDISTDVDLHTETDPVSIRSDEENPNEASFEMVMQNRQNSFNGTPASKIHQKNKGENEVKVMSKLPVYQNTKSLLRPPKLFIKPDNLKTSSYKFAKHISKLGSDKPSNLPMPEINKLPGPLTVKTHVNSPLEKEKTFTKTPARFGTPRQKIATQTKVSSSLTKSKIPSHSYLPINRATSLNTVNKTPAKITTAKTPVQNISNIPRAVKSDSKVKRVLTPLCSSSEKDVGKNVAMKNRYKNIVSPIQAYIRGSTPVSQRKAHVIDEQQDKPDEKLSTTQDVTALTLPRAIQKLQFENVQGQENVNPNVVDPSRDTIPFKVLEPSLEVFWKEREQLQPRLPKMGDKQTKILLDGPTKVKLTRHEGRVNQSPNSKGVLVPNKENSSSISSEILGADSLPEQSDGRISIRIQKTVDLP